MEAIVSITRHSRPGGLSVFGQESRFVGLAYFKGRDVSAWRLPAYAVSTATTSFFLGSNR